jgi:Outer membrane lipoprotein carrier protein LolA-like
MTFGKLFLSLLSCLALPSFAWDIELLMQGLAKQKANRVAFVELRYFAHLDAPLEMRGFVSVNPPHQLSKETLSPVAELMQIDEHSVSIKKAGKTQSLAIADSSITQAMVGSLRGVLTGNLAAVKPHFQIELTGNAKAWRLQLTPTDSKAKLALTSLVVSGSEQLIRTVETVTPGNNRSLMTLIQ